MEKDLELDLDFEDVEEVAETPTEDYSQGFEAESGEVYNGEEMEYWGNLQGQATELLQQGYDENEVVRAMNTNFKSYIEKKDLQEFIDGEKQHGFTKDDISDEAWKLYEKNIGKKKLVDCIYDSSDFLKGLNNDKPVYSSRSKRHSDPFLDGFDSL